MQGKINRLVDEVERIEFISEMKNTVFNWKERIISELKWVEELEKMGFKKEERKED